jgi:hypothetical protein
LGSSLDAQLLLAQSLCNCRMGIEMLGAGDVKAKASEFPGTELRCVLQGIGPHSLLPCKEPKSLWLAQNLSEFLPHYITSHHITSHHITSHHITLHSFSHMHIAHAGKWVTLDTRRFHGHLSLVVAFKDSRCRRCESLRPLCGNQAAVCPLIAGELSAVRPTV